MNELNYYVLFNPELKNLNINTLKKLYNNDLKLNEENEENLKVISLKSFFKKYPNFIHSHNDLSESETAKITKDYVNDQETYDSNKKNLESFKPFSLGKPSVSSIGINRCKPSWVPLNIQELVDWHMKNLVKNISYEVFHPVQTTANAHPEEALLEANEQLFSKDFENIISSDTSHSGQSLRGTVEEKYNSKKRLAHIFIHFFEVGGGERYLSKFNQYNIIFKETLFIKNPKNKLETFFNFNIDIIYYKSYEELNELLIINNFDIILDHQLYWFNIDIEKKVFNDITISSIIRIIHGVPIHYEDITNRNFYYSVELYSEKDSHISWNKHIKLYHNLGVPLTTNIGTIHSSITPTIFCEFKESSIEKALIKPVEVFHNLPQPSVNLSGSHPEQTILVATKNDCNILLSIESNKNQINIAIVGRIDSEKVPIKFLDQLIIFIKKEYYKKNNDKNIYIFNFYGPCDKSYEKYFLTKINNEEYIGPQKELIGSGPSRLIESYTKTNESDNYKEEKKNTIIYHGIINPENISSIYLTNHILLHPSKTECGSTVILEAMSYGLPILCRNTGGLPYVLSKENREFCKDITRNDKDFFDKLLELTDELNQDRLSILSKKNILKVTLENNETIVYPKLIQNIYNLSLLNNSESIPNIIHYIFGLNKQTEPFLFPYYLSIYSNIVINNPGIIYFHYQYEPYGIWWDKIKPYLHMNYINAENLYWGKKKIKKTAHKADKLRLDILYKYGGIYMDIDTISYQPYLEKIYNFNKYDFIIGIQEENYGPKKITLYCNAILFAKKNNIFIKKWINMYEDSFLPNGWCEASIHLPTKIFNLLNTEEISKIKIFNKYAFYYPLYNETYKIFENISSSDLCKKSCDEEKIELNKNLITLHLWNSYSYKYLKNINGFEYINTNNSLYSKLMKNIVDIEKNNK